MRGEVLPRHADAGRVDAGGQVSGIRDRRRRTELLGVRPRTLRSWERRFGYPRPRARAGRPPPVRPRRELESLRRALLRDPRTSHRRSSSPSQRRRGSLLARPGCSTPSTTSTSPAEHRILEESLALRSVERTVEEAFLPARRARPRARSRPRRRARARQPPGHRIGCTPPERVVPPASRPQGVLLLRLEPRASTLRSLHVQALRAGPAPCRVPHACSLAFDLPARAGASAPVRALDPTAFVFCGGEATLEVVGRLVCTVRQAGSAAPVFEYRESMPVTGAHGIPSLGSRPGEAVERLKGYVDSGRLEQIVVSADPSVPASSGRCELAAGAASAGEAGTDRPRRGPRPGARPDR